jgi:hypothetical protein
MKSQAKIALRHTGCGSPGLPPKPPINGPTFPANRLGILGRLGPTIPGRNGALPRPAPPPD